MEPNKPKGKYHANPIKRYIINSLKEFQDYANNSILGGCLGYLIFITILSVVAAIIFQ